MTAGMRAAFTLTLEDKLSSGLNALKKQLDALRGKGEQLTLGKLERGGEMLRAMGREIRNLTSDMRAFHGTVDRTWASLKEMAHERLAPRVQAIKKWGEPLTKAGAIGAAVEGYSVIQPIRAYAEYQNSLKHSAITGGMYGAESDKEVARLNKMFTADALATGQNSAKISDAYYEILTGGVEKNRLDQAIGAHSRFATAYRLDVKDAGQLSIALMKNMGLTTPQYEAALGQTGQISKQGLFKPSAYSQFMPGITGQMKVMGMTGPDATLQALSALQIVRRTTGDDSTAATDLKVLLEHIYAPIQERAMRLHGKQVPADLRQMVQENAGAWKSTFGVDYAGYMRDQEKSGIKPLDSFINLMKRLSKAPDFTDKMRIFGQLIHTQQAASAANALISNYDDWMKMRADGRTKGAEVFEKDFAEAMRGSTASLNHLTEGLTQLDRRVGEGFAPVLTPLNGGLDLLLAATNKLDQAFPGLGNAVLTVTGGMLTLGATLGALGVIGPKVKLGATMAGDAAVAAGLTNPLTLGVALPVAALGVVAKIGSDADTPQNRAALDVLAKERRSAAGGPNGGTFDGFGPDGFPLGSLGHPEPGKLDVTIHADPGTSATVNAASAGIVVNRPYGGQTTNRP